MCACSCSCSTEEVAACGRLIRECFADIVKLKERLDKLEEEAGLAGSSAPDDATPMAGDSTSFRGAAAAGRGADVPSSVVAQHHARRRLAGVLRMGGGLMWAEVRAHAAVCCCMCLSACFSWMAHFCVLNDQLSVAGGSR